MLGGFRIVRGDHASARIENQKTGALLAYLAFYSSEPHRREVLVDVLWPEAESESGLSRLKNLLWLLKQEVGSDQPLLIATRSDIQLNPHACTTDVGEYLKAIDAAGAAGDAHQEIARLSRAISSS